MSDRTFRVVRDSARPENAEQRDATLDEFAELQAQGFRVDDVSGYQAAVRAAEGDEDPADVYEAPTAEQSRADANLTAKMTYPEAEPEGDDGSDVSEPETPVSAANDSDSAYAEMTVGELREEIDNRGLDVDRTARKADLVAALEADDAAR